MTLAADQFLVISDTEPGVTLARMWLETNAATNTCQLWVRAEDDSDWLQASAGVSAVTGGPDRYVGVWADFDGGDFSGLIATLLNSGLRFSDPITGNVARVLVNSTLVFIEWGGTTTIGIELSDAGMRFTGDVPTVNPMAVGVVWNDGGTLKISAG